MCNFCMHYFRIACNSCSVLQFLHARIGHVTIALDSSVLELFQGQPSLCRHYHHVLERHRVPASLARAVVELDVARLVAMQISCEFHSFGLIVVLWQLMRAVDNRG